MTSQSYTSLWCHQTLHCLKITKTRIIWKKMWRSATESVLSHLERNGVIGLFPSGCQCYLYCSRSLQTVITQKVFVVFWCGFQHNIQHETVHIENSIPYLFHYFATFFACEISPPWHFFKMSIFALPFGFRLCQKNRKLKKSSVAPGFSHSAKQNKKIGNKFSKKLIAEGSIFS